MKKHRKNINSSLFILLWSCVILVTTVLPSWTQQINKQPSGRHPAKDLPLQSVLYDLDHNVSNKRAEALTMIRKKGLVTRADGRVNVEIINQMGKQPLDPSIVSRFGGEVDAVWGRGTSAWIPPDQLIALAKALPSGYYIKQVSVPEADNEGPAATGSLSYLLAGADGSGIRIGVIDAHFAELDDAVDEGTAPENYLDFDYTGEGLTGGDDTHGTCCVETIFDHVPGATYYLYRIRGLEHFGMAVQNAIDNGVSIISHSLSRYNTGWEDNSGMACEVVENATNNGILFFTSAGNRARQHWQGNFNDPDGDGWHNWSDEDEAIDIIFDDEEDGNFHLSWNPSGGIFDYDLYLFNEDLTTELDISSNGENNFERISYENDTGSRVTVKLAVLMISGGSTEMEVFLHGDGTWQQHIVSTSSTASPSNSTEENCISVGAVSWIDYITAPGLGGIIRNYSSRGPTNEGATKPILCGPTDTWTFTDNGPFGGTSCATPNIAGTAAALWSMDPNLGACCVRQRLIELAETFKDWGSNGFDNTYGNGGCVLLPHHTSTSIYVDVNHSGIEDGSQSFPFNTVFEGHLVSLPGDVIRIHSGNYDEELTLCMNVTIYAEDGTVTIGHSGGKHALNSNGFTTVKRNP